MDAKKPIINLLKRYAVALCLVWQGLILPQTSAYAESLPLRIAVASSFTPLLKQLGDDFARQHNLKIEYISASSGTLFQQISYGAPFDLFLSADSIRPEKLTQLGLANSDTLKTYAIGQLALFGPNPTELNETFLQHYKGRFAIANPKTAPYGQAALEVIERLNIKGQLTFITGQNVAQTYQQIITKGAPVGLVSLGQLSFNQQQGWIIPTHLYNPIEQKMVIPKQARQPIKAERFQRFLLSASTQERLGKLGFKAVSNGVQN